ncbi:hypothetical protein [uncultured Prochlorococcus sp.]|uniref:hypothetical protein n=1 Tax=uncultured Prochlorococcus sp. TaxID=159733 RepID=UPI00258773A7|nr:hypothetical protein [uncultured Prochlorococcus sp.]
MNIKDRGITVGDLLIILLIIFTTIVIVKANNKENKSTLNISNQEIISYKKFLHQKIFN